MTKYVIGDYTNQADAENIVDSLIEDGYPTDSISLVANTTVMDQLTDAGLAVDTNYIDEDDDESLWQRVKDFFGFDNDDDEYRQGISVYRQDIENGNILVLVEDEDLSDDMKAQLATMDSNYWQNCCNRAEDTSGIDQQVMNDDQTISLEAERLNVNKSEVEAGEVVINKRVVEDTQTINVPVRHEEVVVERVPVTDGRVGDADFDSETFTIPLSQEQVHVSKEPVVTEQVRVSKRDVESTEQVSANLRREELDVEREGDVSVTNTDR